MVALLNVIREIYHTSPKNVVLYRYIKEKIFKKTKRLAVIFILNGYQIKARDISRLFQNFIKSLSKMYISV